MATRKTQSPPKTSELDVQVILKNGIDFFVKFQVQLSKSLGYNCLLYDELRQTDLF